MVDFLLPVVDWWAVLGDSFVVEILDVVEVILEDGTDEAVVPVEDVVDDTDVSDIAMSEQP